MKTDRMVPAPVAGDVVRRTSNSLVVVPDAAPAEPSMPPDLRHAVLSLEQPLHNPSRLPREKWTDEDRERAMVLAPPDLGAISADTRSAAARLLRVYEDLLRPASGGDHIALLLEWLRPIAMASSNPPDKAEFAARASGIAEMLEGYPAAAFTRQAAREAGFGFFPGAREIRQALDPRVNAWRSRAAALRKIVEAEAAPAADDGGTWFTREDALRSLAKYEASPRDRWTRAGAAQLAETIQRLHPGLFVEVADRLRPLVTIPDVSTQAGHSTSPTRPVRPMRTKVLLEGYRDLAAREVAQKGAVSELTAARLAALEAAE